MCTGSCLYTLSKRTHFLKAVLSLPLLPSFSSLNGKHWTQMPNHRRYSSRSSIWLPGKPSRRVVWGALPLSLALSRVSDTMASLAGMSRQLPIPFGSPLILRNSSLISMSYWTYFCPHCSEEFQDRPHSSLSVSFFCSILSCKLQWNLTLAQIIFNNTSLPLLVHQPPCQLWGCSLKGKQKILPL